VIKNQPAEIPINILTLWSIFVVGNTLVIEENNQHYLGFANIFGHGDEG
jgi:hypothetical protein